MAAFTRSGVTKTLAGVYPLEDALKMARSDPIVMAMLQPLQAGREAHQGAGKGLQRTSRTSPYSKGKGKGSASDDQSKGKKGKGKGKRPASRMPKALFGTSSHDKAGKPICYDCNLDGCDRAELGKECSKGRHICCYCFGLHVLHDCPDWNKSGKRNE